MGSSKPAFAAMLVLFAALWLPLGQGPFLAEHWMKIGTFAAPMLVFMAFTTRAAGAGPMLADVKLIATAMAAAYMMHQFEEHWVDLYGRLYPLQAHLNQLMATLFGPDSAEAMTPEALFFINTSVVWLIAFLAIWCAPRHVFPAVAMAGVLLVNGTGHTVIAVVSGAYNPGLVTSLVLFLPLSLVFYRHGLRSGIVRPIVIAGAIGWAVLAHVILFGGLLAANVHGIIPVSVYYAMLIAWAIVPIFVFRQPAMRPEPA